MKSDRDIKKTLKTRWFWQGMSQEQFLFFFFYSEIYKFTNYLKQQKKKKSERRQWLQCDYLAHDLI